MPVGGEEAPPPEVVWAAGTGGSIWQLVDGSWQAQASPTEQDLFALWGPAVDSVWAVGAAGTALHFDGATWSPVPTGVDVSLRDVHGSGERDVWAVGDGGVIVHWDGNRWSSVAGPSAEDLLTVWVSESNQGWIGGPTGSLLEWDGESWRLQTISTRPMVVKDLAGLSATDLWAVTGERHQCIDSSYDGEGRDGGSSQLLHRGVDGWREEFTLADNGVNLRAVVALDSDDVWVLGGTPVWDFGGWRASVLRWDGARWSGEAVSAYGDEFGDASLTSVWGTDPAHLWSGGGYGLLRRGDTAWVGDGGPGPVNAIWGPAPPRSGCVESDHCESLALPDPPEVEPSPCAGVACQSGVCDAAAGDGSCWCPEEFHADQLVCVADTPCTGVTCSDIGTCVVEGDASRCDCPAGTVDQGGFACAPISVEGNCNADGWCVELPLPIAEVTALWADGPEDVWAVGPAGQVARRTGAGWQRVDLGTRESLVDVSGTGADDVWMISATAVYHWDGTSLAEVEVDCTGGAYGNQMYRYRGIEAVAQDQIWLVGERLRLNDEPADHTGVCVFDRRRWHPLRGGLSQNAWGECGSPVECDDVWTSPGGDIWCGGGDFCISDNGCGVARWVDGSLVPMPGLRYPDDIWGASPDDVWAIADGAPFELFHWDGSVWTSTGITGVYAIDGVSADDVWATGVQVQHWDGEQWSIVGPGDRAPVVAVGPNEAIVAPRDVASLHLVHYVGATGTDESVTVPMQPRALWGAAADDLWIGGRRVIPGRTGLAHWNGLTWTAVDVPGLTTVYELLGFAADDVWVLGDRLARFDGAWTSMAVTDLDFGYPVVARQALWLSGTASDDVWLYGYERTAAAEAPFLAHWNGGAWSTIPAPSNVQAIWATGNRLWVAYTIPATEQSVMSRWDGVTWQDFGPPLNRRVQAIFGVAEDDIWAAGYGGMVLHWDGVAWEPVDVGSNTEFSGIWGTASDDIWLAGGIILHFDGSQWSQQQLPAGANVERVFGVDGELWATGEYVLHKK